jgi:hypothetical protein
MVTFSVLAPSKIVAVDPMFCGCPEPKGAKPIDVSTGMFTLGPATTGAVMIAFCQPLVYVAWIAAPARRDVQS